MEQNKGHFAILNLLLKSDNESLEKCIWHCEAKESAYGCSQSEQWIASWIPDIDFEDREDEYNIYKTFGFAKIYSYINYADQDKFIKAVVKDITRTFSNYSIFKYTNVLKRMFNI